MKIRRGAPTMVRYEHLPIYRAAFDLACTWKKLVRHFSRYHKYTLPEEPRKCGRRVIELVIEVNGCRDREPILLQLRRDLERLKVLVRLWHELGWFSGTRAQGMVFYQAFRPVPQHQGCCSGLHSSYAGGVFMQVTGDVSRTMRSYLSSGTYERCLL